MRGLQKRRKGLASSWKWLGLGLGLGLGLDIGSGLGLGLGLGLDALRQRLEVDGQAASRRVRVVRHECCLQVRVPVRVLVGAAQAGR